MSDSDPINNVLVDQLVAKYSINYIQLKLCLLPLLQDFDLVFPTNPLANCVK
jgi:hypothetical protein